MHNFLCSATSTPAAVESEALWVAMQAVFNYDFDSLSKDDPVIQAVYTTLREAEHRSLTPIPYWKLPFADDLIPRQARALLSLKIPSDNQHNANPFTLSLQLPL
jgi:hypothetical protein